MATFTVPSMVTKVPYMVRFMLSTMPYMVRFMIGTINGGEPELV